MKLVWFRCVILWICVSIACSKSLGDGFQLVTKALKEYLTTGVRPLYLNYALEQYPLHQLFSSLPEKIEINDSQVCFLCRIVADLLILERRLGMTNVQIAAEATFICTLLKIENERVCEGVIKPNADIFLYMIDNNKDITGNQICGLVLQNKNCDSSGNYEWSIDIPPGKTVDKIKANGTKTFNVLHLSDIHYDPRYTPGKSKECHEPSCCQDDQADGTDDSNSCGYWAEYYSADTPFHTVQETFKQIATHKFDYIYYTGDTIRHRVWSTSMGNNSKDITIISDQFKKYFDVPVFPVLGNHEPHPVNAWSPAEVHDENVSTQWLFDLIAEQWGDWLTEDAKVTILKGGYYSISPKKGFRVIALNNNVCYTENWWLIDENKDPYGQLAWLTAVLLEAENNNESVHILMHMPTGTGSCLRSWSREYGKIIRRFANTITGQFTGHSHKDELWVYYDGDESRQAISVSWNGASLMSDKSNPSYKIYQIDGNTFDVLDFEEWTFNLTLANLDTTKDVEWYKLYSFKDAYGVNSLQPTEVDDLLTRMATDHSLLQKYYNFKYRNSDVAVRNGCDEACEKSQLCYMVTTMPDEISRCKILEQLYDQNKQ